MPHATRPGDLLGDRYRLVDLLTESDGGRFWRAHDGVLERHVALHVIRGDDDRAPALMEAARRSATVLDPRILRVLDAESTDEECYVVNEWGWGASLDIVVAGRGPLSPRRAAWLVAEVADAVAVAHAAGVAHGRLNPENVLVDRTGGIRIIGLCVDAALHGIDPVEPAALDRDLEDLAGLLYCGVTAKWGGPSGSIVPAAPRAGGRVLRPRQVRAGIPRALDLLCEELLDAADSGRSREPGEVERSARGVADHLHDFVGDPTGMPAALLASTPDVLPEEEQVVLPPVPVLLPHDADEREAPEVPAEPAPDALGGDGWDATGETDGLGGPGSPVAGVAVDLPTEAGVPIFGEDDDVSWLERRVGPVPPPPPFDVPPERPLFDPGAERTPRQQDPRDDDAGSAGSGAANGNGFFAWDTGAGSGNGSGAGSVPRRVHGQPDGPDRSGDGSVPGRVLLRVGLALAVVVVLAVAILVAVRVGGGEREADPEPEPSAIPTSTGPSSPSTSPPPARAAVLGDVTATAYDPEGDGDLDDENPDTAANAVDGDPDTAWTTSGYNDQFGPPPGLKLGVGLLLDLGGSTQVDEVELALDGSPTTAAIYVTDDPPGSVDGLDPVAEDEADGETLTLDAGGARGRYVVVYLTSLPQGPDGQFRGTVSEVVVRGLRR